MNKTFQNLAKQSKVIVIKVGSNILVNEKFKLRKKWLNSLVDDVAKLQKKGSKIIIVSSGCLLYTSPSPRDRTRSRMPSSA